MAVIDRYGNSKGKELKNCKAIKTELGLIQITATELQRKLKNDNGFNWAWLCMKIIS